MVIHMQLMSFDCCNLFIAPCVGNVDQNGRIRTVQEMPLIILNEKMLPVRFSLYWYTVEWYLTSASLLKNPLFSFSCAHSYQTCSFTVWWNLAINCKYIHSVICLAEFRFGRLYKVLAGLGMCSPLWHHQNHRIPTWAVFSIAVRHKNARNQVNVLQFYPSEAADSIKSCDSHLQLPK